MIPLPSNPEPTHLPNEREKDRQIRLLAAENTVLRDELEAANTRADAAEEKLRQVGWHR